jgi:hypothetical protein
MTKKEHQVRCENCTHLHVGGTNPRLEAKYQRDFHHGVNYCTWGFGGFPDEIRMTTLGCPMNGEFKPVRWCGTCGNLVQTENGCAHRINDGCEHPDYKCWGIHPDLKKGMRDQL